MSFQSLAGALTSVTRSMTRAFGVRVIYRRLGRPTYDTTTGRQTRNEESVEVNATRSEVTEARNDADVRVGDRMYIVARADLPSAPTSKDRIDDAGKTWAVVRWKSDPLDVHYEIQARRA